MKHLIRAVVVAAILTSGLMAAPAHADDNVETTGVRLVVGGQDFETRVDVRLRAMRNGHPVRNGKVRITVTPYNWNQWCGYKVVDRAGHVEYVCERPYLTRAARDRTVTVRLNANGVGRTKVAPCDRDGVSTRWAFANQIGWNTKVFNSRGAVVGTDANHQPGRKPRPVTRRNVMYLGC